MHGGPVRRWLAGTAERWTHMQAQVQRMVRENPDLDISKLLHPPFDGEGPF